MNHKLEFFESIKEAAEDLFQRLALGPSKTIGPTTAWGSPSPGVPGPEAPQDTVVVLDVSGSMGCSDYHPTRLDGGIHAAIAYADTRRKKSPHDRIAVVSFSDASRVVLSLTPVSATKTIERALHRLEIEGGTDITTGLQAAAGIFGNEPPVGHRRCVILLTDGCGGEPLAVAAQLKDRLSVVIDVVGIGGAPSAVNEPLLRQVATTDLGVCHYRFIHDPQTLSEHYTQLAQGLVWRGERK